MPFYVINLHRTDEDRSSSSSNAHEAVQRLHEAEAAGWIVVSILRNDILMDEHSLRDDADREDRYFGSRSAEAKPYAATTVNNALADIRSRRPT